MAETELKPGKFTSEMWLSLLVVVVNAGVGGGIVAMEQFAATPEQFKGFVDAGGLATKSTWAIVVYIVGRNVLKAIQAWLASRPEPQPGPAPASASDPIATIKETDQKRAAAIAELKDDREWALSAAERAKADAADWEKRAATLQDQLAQLQEVPNGNMQVAPVSEASQPAGAGGTDQ